MRVKGWVLVLVCVAFALGVMPGISMAKMQVKFGHVAPHGHGQTVAVDYFAKYVLDKTNGEIEIKTFPMGQLGGERSMAEQVQAGTIQIASITTAVLSNFVPQAAILDLPFLFPDRRTAYAVLGSELREVLFSFFPKKGFVAIGFTENEFRDLTNSKRPIKAPADLQGLKIRTMESPIFIDTYKQLGANPVPMPFPEIYNALQQGVIDGQDNPLYTSILMKFTEVNKYATISGHLLTECIIIVNQDWWNKLKPEYQNILKEAAYNTEVVNRGYTLQDMLALKKLAKIEQGTCKETPGPSIYEMLKSQNVQVVELTPKEKEEFKKAVEPVYKKYREEIGPDFFDQFLAKVKEIQKNIK